MQGSSLLLSSDVEPDAASTKKVATEQEICGTGGSMLGHAQLGEQVARLTAEVALLRQENAELKADLYRLRGSDQTSAPEKTTPQKISDEQGVLLLVQKELTAMVARINALEGVVLRPPLAAGEKAPAKSYSAAAAGLGKSSRTGRRTITPATNEAVLLAPTVEVKSRQAITGARRKPSRAMEAQTIPKLPVAAASSNGARIEETRWTVAGDRKAAKKAAKKKARRARKAAKKVAASLRAPKSTAVVVTLQPGAVEKGTSYRDVLTKVRTVVDLNELGIPDGIRMRVTRTGARMLEVPGSTSNHIADALAEKLRASLDNEVVRISRPTKCADLRISGLDDSVTVEEVVVAVAKTGGCPPGQVRTGAIRIGPSGLGATIVTCPVTAANKIVEGRRILVGWASAHIKLLDPRPLRCYRCLIGRHTGVKCTSEVDRSNCCFRCGQPGHKAGQCNASPHCIFCEEAGKPANHRAGGRACSASSKPKTGAKSAATASISTETSAVTLGRQIGDRSNVTTPSAASSSNMVSQEEAAMECH